MSRIVVCMDCPNYRKGGHCAHKRKDVAALTPICDYAKAINHKFNPEDTEETMTTVSAEDYQETHDAPVEIQPNLKCPASGAFTKRCPRCGRELPADAFGRHARTRDGLQPYCKDCRSEARMGKTRRPGRETATKYTKTAQEQPGTTVVVRETLTDKQMVDILRGHGWTVTATRTITEEL